MSGNGKENTKLTIVILRRIVQLFKINQVKNIKYKRTIIAEVVTDSDGNWSTDIPIDAPGTYQFLVYENYDEPNARVSSTYTYDIKLATMNLNLNLAPSPFNPLFSTLKIEYILSENSNVTLQIYSITGQKVYTKTLLQSQFRNQPRATLLNGMVELMVSLLLQAFILSCLKPVDQRPEIKTKRLGVKW